MTYKKWNIETLQRIIKILYCLAQMNRKSKLNKKIHPCTTTVCESVQNSRKGIMMFTVNFKAPAERITCKHTKEKSNFASNSRGSSTHTLHTDLECSVAQYTFQESKVLV